MIQEPGSYDCWVIMNQGLTGIFPQVVSDPLFGKRWRSFNTEWGARLAAIEDLEAQLLQCKRGDLEFFEINFEEPIIRAATEWTAEGILTTEGGEYNLKDYA